MYSCYMAKWDGLDVSLETLISRTNMEEIMAHYDAQKPDEFGCKICDHVLLNMEKMLRTKDFCLQTKRLQTDCLLYTSPSPRDPE